MSHIAPKGTEQFLGANWETLLKRNANLNSRNESTRNTLHDLGRIIRDLTLHSIITKSTPTLN